VRWLISLWTRHAKAFDLVMWFLICSLLLLGLLVMAMFCVEYVTDCHNIMRIIEKK
jgi:hypothetical protein